MASTLENFTTGSTIATDDFIVGYDTATLGGERKWQYNTIVNSLSGDALIAAKGSTTKRALADRFADVVNVLDFGADPTGVVNSATAIQNAINYANLSTTKKFVYIPSGKYKISSQLQTYSNITISGDINGSTILDYSTQTTGHFIYTVPTVGSPIAISSNIGRYATSVSTASPHGASVGDKYALLSQRNALSRDGGDWQLGIGTGSLKSSYYSEILNVKTVTDSDTFEFYPPLIFPDYNTNNSAETANTTRSCNIPTVASGNYDFTITLASGNTTGLVEGMTVTGTGIPSNYIVRISAIINSTQIRMYSSSNAGFTATNGTTLTFTINSRANSDIRKITFVDDVKIQHINFISGTGTNKINLYGVNNGLVKNCHFSLNSVGEGINYLNCYNTKSLGCTVFYTAGIANSYTYNPFSNISSWNCGYEDCKIENGYQGFDITYADGFFGNDVLSPSIFAYVDKCTSINCSNGMTSHSGSYGVKVTNNQFLYCNVGIFLRSPNSICTGNFIIGDDSADGSGVQLNNFCYNALVSNNIIEACENGIYISSGVSTLGFGIKNLRSNVNGNIIRRCTTGMYTLAYDTYHKSADLTNISFTNNTISNCSKHINITQYSNGVSIIGNNLVGPTTGGIEPSISIGDNCFSVNVRDNMFSDIGTINPITVGTLTDTTVYPSSNNKYRTNMVFWSGNKFFGDTVGAQQIFATGADPTVNNKYVDSGTYTPAVVNQSNVSAVTLGLCNFSVKDRVCTISGRITITPSTIGANTNVNITPPIPSNLDLLSTNGSANGVAINVTSVNTPNVESAVISADVVSPYENTVFFNFYSTSLDAREFRYIYQYPIW